LPPPITPLLMLLGLN